MPFLMSAEDAAAKIARRIERGTSYSVIPWQMAIVARILHVLPNAVFDRFAGRSLRKPRRGQ
jgi:short-subunit dehydrogenase